MIKNNNKVRLKNLKIRNHIKIRNCNNINILKLNNYHKQLSNHKNLKGYEILHFIVS